MPMDNDTNKTSVVTEALDSIRNIIKELKTINGDAESNFVDLGSRLQSLFAESNEMTESAQHAVNTVSRENNISSIINDISSHILTRFNGVKSNNMMILEHATKASALIRNLAKKTPEIRKIDKELWILGSNLAIQAAWSPHTEKMFGEYSEELKQFSKSIKKVFLEFQTDLKGMNDSIQELQSSIRTETQRLEELILQSRQNIQDATTQLEELLADSVVKIRFIEDTSRQMSSRVADIVTSIQFNDITRQQMEHVIEVLQETSSNESPFEIYRRMRIQDAQMDQVTQTLSGAITTIEASFDEIIRCGVEIANQYRRGTETTHDDSPFAKIKTALRELEDLLELSATLRDRTIQSMQIASVASDRLASHLDKIAEITGELNLQAINALVMSRNIGQGGSSLVALSKEVHSLSKESTTTVEQVVHILTEVGTQTYELSSLASEDTDVDNTAQLKEGFDQIDEIGSRYFQAIEHTTVLSQTLQSHAKNISNQSKFVRKLGGRLSDANQHLKTAAELLAQHAVQEDNAISDLKQRYTMESERLIHDRVQQELNGISNPHQGPSPATQTPAMNDTPDDALGDFELF